MNRPLIKTHPRWGEELMDRAVLLAVTGLISLVCLLSAPVLADPSGDKHMFGQAHDLHLMTPHSVDQELAADRFLNAGRTNAKRIAINQTDRGLKLRSEPLERFLKRLRSSSRAVRIADRLLGSRDKGFRLKVDPGDEEVILTWRARIR